ncbi:anti-repressor SinI family protein [Jeotgalibacillus sp. R-1-5s-1]|nr:anti-repressor SinI family protein [Jeotgalibacillus sp. R-1-5s-1]TFE01308.1 DNA-binding anti-repressor SinI [Jeotgalibacillus sp. R-1-5s-1]
MGQKHEVDMEWVALIKEAVEAGIPKEEITKFLKSQESVVWSQQNLFAG